jgi:hypothetical protein
MLAKLNLIALLIILLQGISFSSELCIPQTKADSLVVAISKAHLYKSLVYQQDSNIKDLNLIIENNKKELDLKDSLFYIAKSQYDVCEDNRQQIIKANKKEIIKYSIISFLSGSFVTLLVTSIF